MLKGFDHEEEVLKDFHFDVSGLVFTNLGPARYGPNAVAVLDLGPKRLMDPRLKPRALNLSRGANICFNPYNGALLPHLHTVPDLIVFVSFVS